MKTVLCYGDSNTFGANPDGPRFGRDVRWTGQLQTLLGTNDYYVIEEGLGGRTSAFFDGMDATKTGTDYLPIVLGTHTPIDLMVICLGTNDCKTAIQASAKAIAKGLERVVNLVRNTWINDAYIPPKILILSPILIGSDIENCPYPQYDISAVQKSKELGEHQEEMALRKNCYFLDLATVAKPGSDCLHMNAEGHTAVAKAVCEKIQEIFE